MSIIFKNTVRLVILLAGLWSSATAQSWELGGWIGAAHYFGDLNPSFGLKSPGPAIGLIGRYNPDQRISLRAGLNYENVGYSDDLTSNPFQKQRNLSFRSDIVELNTLFEFNFLPYLHGSKDKRFTPYLFGGIGMFWFNPRAKYNDQWYNLRDYHTEGPNVSYSPIQPQIAYGFGFKIDLSDMWSLNIELSGRALFTDYLDDVSGVYPDFNDLQRRYGAVAVALSDRSGEITADGSRSGAPGRQRGDALTNDSFGTIGIGLTYNFADVKCPDNWKRRRK